MVHEEAIPPGDPAPLVRVPIPDVDGSWLEVVAPHESVGPELAFFELGIEIATMRWPEAWLALAPFGAPFRVVVDSVRVPTNVSRSKVAGEHASRVVEASRRAFPSLVDALLRAHADAHGRGREESFVVDAAKRERARALDDALGSFAAVRFRTPTDSLREAPDRIIVDALTPLLSLPLLASATGAPRTFDDAVRSSPIFLHRGKAPLNASIELLMPDVFWDRGHGADRGLGGRDAREIKADLAAGAKRLAASLRSPEATVAVAPTSDHVAHTHVVRPDGLVADLALRADPLAPSTVRVWIHGRPFETLTDLGVIATAPSFDAAVAWPGRIHPDHRYARVAARSHIAELGLHLNLIAIELLVAEAPSLAARHPGYLRKALAARPALLRDARFANLALWPLLDGSTLTCETALASIRQACGLRFVSADEVDAVRGSLDRPPTGPVFVLDRGEEPAFRPGSGDAEVLAADYLPWFGRDRGTLASTERVLRTFTPPNVPIASIVGDGFFAAATFLDASGTLHIHRGEIVTRDPDPLLAHGLAIAVESDGLLPAEGARLRIPSAALVTLAFATFDMFLDAWDAGFDLAAYAPGRKRMLDLASAHVDAKQSAERVRRLPLFDLVSDGASRAISVEDLERRVETGIPMATPELRGLGSYVAGTERSRQVLAKLVRTPIVPYVPRATTIARNDALHVLDKLERTVTTATNVFRPVVQKPPLPVHANENHGRFFLSELCRLFDDPNDLRRGAAQRAAALGSRIAIPPNTRLDAREQGQAIAYRVTEQTITYDAKHPAVVALIAAGDAASFVAAALAEIDRAVVAVTPSDEWASIVALLDSLPRR